MCGASAAILLNKLLPCGSVPGAPLTSPAPSSFPELAIRFHSPGLLHMPGKPSLAFSAWQAPQFGFCHLLHEACPDPLRSVASSVCPSTPAPLVFWGLPHPEQQPELSQQRGRGKGVPRAQALESDGLDFNPVPPHTGLCHLWQIVSPQFPHLLSLGLMITEQTSHDIFRTSAAETESLYGRGVG